MTDVSAPGDGLVSAFSTHQGRVRTNNEDLPLVDATRSVYGVIDGIGGQAAGEVAASVARDVIVQRLSRPLGSPAERVREAIALANNEIFSRAEADPGLRGMACVVTLAIVADGVLTIGHVGDSRLYKITPGGLRKLTHDHSPVGEREDAHEITEIEAMRHPRRNEVFRDIGSSRRDKDEDDFVEIVHEPLDGDSAILLCSDGLTDMISSAAIDQVVRRFAGSPQDVADALVAAANEAGGRDNVTVVYAEAPGFAQAVRRDPAASAALRPPSREPSAARPGIVGRVVRSRTTWFSVGALAGVLAALGFFWRMSLVAPEPRRTLTVGGEGPLAFTRIAEAMAEARSGDTIRLEPGTYAERVNLRDGVDLQVRVGTATIVRPSNASGEVVGLTLYGSSCGKVSGIRIASTPAARVDIGIRISGQGCTLEQVDVAGDMTTGLDVTPAAGAVVRNSLFAVHGPVAVLGDESSATFVSNTMLGLERPPAAIILAASSRLDLQRNVFAGFGSDVVKGVAATARQQLLAGNFVIASQPSLLQ